MKISILGSGLVGSAMAKDLSEDPHLEIELFDASEKSLLRIGKTHKIKTVKSDLSSKKSIEKIVFDSDLVISALPGFMGFSTLKTVIELGKNVVDISFAPEDCTELDDLAKQREVTAVIDAGVAPGMSNMLVSRGSSFFQKTISARIYVGGLPLVRYWPYEYKAGFSPIDVLQEYTRPVFCVENSKIIEKEALSEVENLDFEGIGTLEAFNTDGLRSLVKTMNIPNMVEKTLRYPGHAEKMRILRSSGFFDEKPINLNGIEISPISLTSKLLFPMWELEEGEAELTVMKIIVEGEVSGKNKKYECFLKDVYDPKTKIHSMARTTGYTATMIARLILNGEIDDHGVIPPEKIGKVEKFMKFVFEELKKRNINYDEIIPV